MERKSLVLILLVLCVLFILEEEVFHFDAFSTRPAADAQLKNLTRSGGDSGPPPPPPSRVPDLRTVLFTRSRNHYAGTWNKARGGKGAGTGTGTGSGSGRGLEGIVQAELRRTAGEGEGEGEGGRGGYPRNWDNDNYYNRDNLNRPRGYREPQQQQQREERPWIDEDEKAGVVEEEEEESETGDGVSELFDDGVEVTSEENGDVEEESQGRTRGVNQVYEEEEKMRSSPYIYREEDETRKKLDAAKGKGVKYISYYLPWEENEHRKHFTFCRYKNCAFVNNMSHADLVSFKASDIRDHVIAPFHRPQGQRWLMYTSDPATKKYAFTRADVLSSFNWTMTYQLDADAPRIFGRLRQQPQPQRDYEKLFDNKARLAAWFVSHCETWSKREDYVKQMQKVMEVDIFGQCGNLTCGVSHYRVNDKNLCLPMLTNEYKFYLSFENSFCPDYITEKFFKLFQNIQVIPVVRGGFNYKKYLPSGIFIDASDFEGPEDLAKHLIALGNDKKRYVEMLKRKDRWVTVPLETRHCRMCEIINTHWNHQGFHSNLRYKFNGHPLACWTPRDL